MSPWLHEQHRREPEAVAHLMDCRNCQKQFSAGQRQLMACGLEPPAPVNMPVEAWSPRGMNMRWRGIPGYPDDAPWPKTCPGYTTSLPEVLEVNRARVHWSKGSLPVFTGNEPPTEQLVLAIELLEGAHNDVARWSSTPKKEGGGGT